MSATHPKPGTVAFRALALLHALGGSALPAQLMSVQAREYSSIGKIRKSIAYLEERRMVWVDDNDTIHITEVGREHLYESGAAMKVRLYVGEVASVRAARDFVPLSVSAFAKMMSGGPKRPGMDDLRTAPSLMGGKRVSQAGGGQ